MTSQARGNLFSIEYSFLRPTQLGVFFHLADCCCIAHEIAANYPPTGDLTGPKKGLPKSKRFVDSLQVSQKLNVLLIINILFPFLLLIINLFFLIKNSNNKNSVAGYSYIKDPIWALYLNNDLRALLVLGDYYLMKDLSIPGRSRYIRNSQIN